MKILFFYFFFYLISHAPSQSIYYWNMWISPEKRWFIKTKIYKNLMQSTENNVKIKIWTSPLMPLTSVTLWHSVFQIFELDLLFYKILIKMCSFARKVNVHVMYVWQGDRFYLRFYEIFGTVPTTLIFFFSFFYLYPNIQTILKGNLWKVWNKYFKVLWMTLEQYLCHEIQLWSEKNWVV